MLRVVAAYPSTVVAGLKDKNRDSAPPGLLLVLITRDRNGRPLADFRRIVQKSVQRLRSRALRPKVCRPRFEIKLPLYSETIAAFAENGGRRFSLPSRADRLQQRDYRVHFDLSS